MDTTANNTSGSRGLKRLRILIAALNQSIRTKHRPPDGEPKRILVAHKLLLGDTLMLAALFATLRARYPNAEIFTTVDPLYQPLFFSKPYGVIALPYNTRDSASITQLLDERKRGGFDLAFIPGDNRYAILAHAMGARWIVTMAGDIPEWKNRLCDVEVTWPAKQTSLPECFARMAGIRTGNTPPLRYAIGDWAAPCDETDFIPPNYDYAILHIGARSPLRRWNAAGWRQLADRLAGQGIAPIWSAGPGEDALVKEIDSTATYLGYLGTLTLSDLWRLFAAARLVICPDTGVSHMAKLIGIPTLCLYGPGSPQIFGAGEFFANMPFMAVGAQRYHCRDQKTLFRRNISWVRRCQRSINECPHANCMSEITTDDVLIAARRLTKGRIRPF